MQSWLLSCLPAVCLCHASPSGPRRAAEAHHGGGGPRYLRHSARLTIWRDLMGHMSGHFIASKQCLIGTAMLEPHRVCKSLQYAGRLRCLADFSRLCRNEHSCPQSKAQSWPARAVRSCIGSQLCTAVAVQGEQLSLSLALPQQAMYKSAPQSAGICHH